MRFDFVIIGGGASGALAATQLFRRAGRAISVCMVDPATRLGAGLAYGRAAENHLLNVPASRISAIAGEELDFVHWLGARGLLSGDPANHFAPRRVYADYLTDCLGRALRHAVYPHVIDHQAVRAVRLEPLADGWRAVLASGEAVAGNRVVLALGNLPRPEPPTGLEALADDTRYLHDPWVLGEHRLKRDRVVAVVGSGLTAVDIVTSLVERGHRGMIEVFSHSGKWPSVHLAERNAWNFNPADGDLHSVVGQIRSQLERAAEAGIAWQDVIDGLRPHTQRLWRQFSDHDKALFCARLAGLWGRARHRMPPQVGAQLKQWQRQGRLRIHAGRPVRATPGRADIMIRGGTEGPEYAVRRVINATGPCADIRQARSRLLDQLLADRIIRPGPLGMGVEADDEGRVIAAEGKPSESLFTIGPMRQGTLLESTAIPEIKVQAWQLAGVILR